MGPLAGYRIIEMAGIGPAPFAAMLLADMGAEVIRIDRREATDLGLPGREPKFEVLHRGRRSLCVDVKSDAGRDVVLRLAANADALIEGFRPGVMERLGLGPDRLAEVNPKLVFGRMTGFGQDGPLAQRAGHDINFIALAGVLHGIGRRGEAPVPPLNLVGDFGGGGMFLAFGVVCALLEAHKSGKGQVVDAAMVDGAACLMALLYGMYAQGAWRDERGVNVLDTGAPWYDAYETKDGKWLAVGAIEARFYAEFIERLGLSGPTSPASTIAAVGRSCAGVSPKPSSSAHATTGSVCSPAATRVSHRSCRSARSATIPTTPCARPSSSATASCSRHLRRAFPARRLRSALRRGSAVPTARQS